MGSGQFEPGAKAHQRSTVLSPRSSIPGARCDRRPGILRSVPLRNTRRKPRQTTAKPTAVAAALETVLVELVSVHRPELFESVARPEPVRGKLVVGSTVASLILPVPDRASTRFVPPFTTAQLDRLALVRSRGAISIDELMDVARHPTRTRNLQRLEEFGLLKTTLGHVSPCAPIADATGRQAQAVTSPQRSIH